MRLTKIITDNGKGNDILKKKEGVVVKNIKSRVPLYNGSVSIVSYPGKGYQLKVTMSLVEYINEPTVVKPIPAF